MYILSVSNTLILLWHCLIVFRTPFISPPNNFCGPFQLCESKWRNAKLNKFYVTIFICLAIKAVHIEITFDLPSEGFIQALKRFIRQRGKPSHIFYDNVTNLASADRELKELLVMFTKEEHPIVTTQPFKVFNDTLYHHELSILVVFGRRQYVHLRRISKELWVSIFDFGWNADSFYSIWSSIKFPSQHCLI